MNDADFTTLNKLIAFVCTCKKRNDPEWMAMLADRINDALAASGSDDRVKWPGKWANEFQFEIGRGAKPNGLCGG